ncbi:MAG TPA: hypothetical protein VFW19_06875 [Allosphingosinicella sp.]|nr:hypothetical protein [Allosphingosinicella sp.]
MIPVHRIEPPGEWRASGRNPFSFFSGVLLRLAFTSPVPPESPQPLLRRRATALILALIVTFLMILALWSLNGRAPERPRLKGATMLDFKPDADNEDASVKQQPTKAQPRQEKQPTPIKPAPPPPRPSPLPVVHPYYIPLTKDENDSADIGRMAHAGPRSGSAQASIGAPGDSRPIGTAPDGSPLYAAEWYREPTDAELDFYLPKNRNIQGSGFIACKTIDHHHVDDCVELGSVPSQSHLASAVRQAAWQFLVRAPRLGGKELVGTWVRIRIDYDIRYKAEDRTDRSDEPPKQPADSTYIPY